jgi:hypothetical protein
MVRLWKPELAPSRYFIPGRKKESFYGELKLVREPYLFGAALSEFLLAIDLGSLILFYIRIR